MLRFSLRSRQLQQQSKTSKRHFNRIKGWWHRLHNKFAAPTHTFGDLSPNRPPLPFLESFVDATDATSRVMNDITPLSRRGRSSHALSSRVQTSGDRTQRQNNLSTIFEESETIKSESSMAPPKSTFEEENKLKRLSDDSRATDEEPNPIHSIGTSSANSYQLPPLWSLQQHNSGLMFDLALVGNEDACRHKFANMVQSVYAIHNEYKGPAPRDTRVVFDGQDNVHYIRFVINGRTEQHKFTGNSQFIPPELVSARDTYSSDLVDVWILGISLYRMLVGKYPFTGSNDRNIFKKMLHGEFSIPQGYSEDVKDLILRMLAPDTTRASLDLILYHEWVKSCKIAIPAPPSPAPPSPSTGELTRNEDLTPNVAPGPLPPSPLPHPPSQPVPQLPALKDRPKQRRLPRILEHAVTFLVKGPYPPPQRPYRDLGQPIPS